MLIPDIMILGHPKIMKAICAVRELCVPLASWRGNGSPRRWWVAGLRGWTATRGLRHGPYSYGRQQWGILDNGGNPDPAILCARWSFSECKVLSVGKKKMTVPTEEVTAKYVPAAAVIRMSQALSGFIGRKARLGGYVSLMWKCRAQLCIALETV